MIISLRCICIHPYTLTRAVVVISDITRGVFKMAKVRGKNFANVCYSRRFCWRSGVGRVCRHIDRGMKVSIICTSLVFLSSMFLVYIIHNMRMQVTNYLENNSSIIFSVFIFPKMLYEANGCRSLFHK